MDTLVYAPAVGRLARLVDLDVETWRQIFDTNVSGAAVTTAAALPHLTASGGTVPVPGPRLVGRDASGGVGRVSSQQGGRRTVHPVFPVRVRASVGASCRRRQASRDVTVKRFPTWGDAADLVSLLDVLPDGDLVFRGGAHSHGRRPVVEGSQILGQAIVAAMRHAPGRRAVWAAMVFQRAADARLPLRLELTETSAGRLFTTLGVHVFHGDRRCATGTMLLHVPSADIIRHEVAAAGVVGPYESHPYDMGVTGRDLRIVDDAYTGDPAAPGGPPVLDCWVRFRDVPDDPALHAGLLAQFTGHMPIAAALRPHEGIGQDQAHRTLSTAINAITLSLHADARADEWMLYRHLSTFAGDGMTHAECRVHDEAGDLLASFSVEAMVRPFPAGSGSQDERTVL
jgi:acyl-CoA thioesterase II